MSNHTNLEVVLRVCEKLHQTLHATPLTEDMKGGIRRAFVSRGKDKDRRLLSRCPSSRDMWAVAAWAGLNPNPWKIPMGTMMMYCDQQQAQFARDLMKVKWPTILDKDAAALDAMGVW